MIIEFIQPLWLLLSLAPILIWHQGRLDTRKLKAFAQPHLWPWIINNDQRRHHKTRLITVSAIQLIIIALSGPVISINSDYSIHSQQDMVFIIDTSTSMSLADVSPNRIQQAKAITQTLLTELNPIHSALVIFAGNAHSILPLNKDQAMMASIIDSLDTTMTRIQGSNLAAGIKQARQLFTTSVADQKTIFLISDGDTRQQQDALSQTSALTRDNIILYTIGIGTTAGQLVLDRFQNPIITNSQPTYSRLSQDFLEKLALSTGGQYIDIYSHNIADIVAMINKQSRNNNIDNPDANYPLYLWPLTLGFILLLWSSHHNWRQGAVICILATVLTGIPQHSHAGIWAQSQAYNALTNGDLPEAIRIYRQYNDYNSLLGLGAAYYRNSQWQNALDAFKLAQLAATSDNERARALFNSGNTLIQLGEYSRAEDMYRQTLQLQAHHKQASINLDLLQKELHRPGKRISEQAESSTRDDQHQTIDKNISGSMSTLTHDRNDQQGQKNQPLEKYSNNRIDNNDSAINKDITKIIHFRINQQDRRLGVPESKQTW